MDNDKGEHWEEGYSRIEEWNDHEHHGKWEVHGEWKKQLGDMRGYIGGQDA
jgi:hypothetical protein